MIMDSNIKKYLSEHPETGRRKLAKVFNISENQARYFTKLFKESMDNDDLSSLIEKKLDNQKILDEHRIERKLNRNAARVVNYNNDLISELIDLFESKPEHTIINHPVEITNEYTGIIQISDAHFNEVVDFPHNKYDLKIAAKRIQKLVYHARKNFKTYGIKNVLIAMTGDMISAMKHIDQIVSMATSRARAVFVAVSIIEQMILDLNQDFNISVCAVAGNESRETSFKLIPTNNMLMSDNIDITIFNTLKLIFRNTSVKFLKNTEFECIVKIRNKNFLFLHGHNINHGNLQKSIQELKGKYSSSGTNIDYVIFGHIHNAHISVDGGFFRSGGLIGDNCYSYNSLNLVGKATQNIYIVCEDGINVMGIDLQNTDGFIGYDFDENLIDKETSKKFEVSEINIM